ncbi:MAG TPA: GntR family transcriptional regulator [Ramlibacter sp.]|uniref:GntR family transcriptional regulator n=1 Tax=Ramlibacter sp. TaxID=1917967 RepID=UPI002ED3CDB3
MKSQAVPLPPAGLARTGTALHRQVYLVLRDRLLSGAIAPEAQLPPEPMLCEQFGVSRITLRRAVADLEEEGLLRRVQGRGTFATAPAAPAHARSEGYVDDVRQLSTDTSVKVLELDMLQAPPWVAARLQIAAGETVQRSVRVRLRHGVPVVLLTAWVPQRWSEGITRADLARRPLNELLRQRGLRFGRVLQEICACLADPLQAQRLEVSVGAALLQVDRLVHDREGAPVEFVGMTLSSERSRMVLDTPAELVEHVSSGRFVHNEAPRGAVARR